MRIALFSWETSHSISIGGIAVHASELACALERKGHEVHVFTRMGRGDHAAYERIFGVHYHRCPFGTHPDFVEEMNNMCRSFVNAFFATEENIWKNGIDRFFGSKYQYNLCSTVFWQGYLLQVIAFIHC
jgi:hypothetical protein